MPVFVIKNEEAVFASPSCFVDVGWRKKRGEKDGGGGGGEPFACLMRAHLAFNPCIHVSQIVLIDFSRAAPNIVTICSAKQGSDKQQPFSSVVGPHYYIFDKGNERLSLTLHDSC